MSDAFADQAPLLAGEPALVGASPWALARRRLLRNRVAMAMVAGFFGGLVDGVLSRALDVVWAFPVYLLAISLSTVLLSKGFTFGPFRLEAGSLLLPIAIIAVVYIPYVARPIRGEVLSLRRREFVEAAVGLGASTWRILWSDILPNVITTV